MKVVSILALCVLAVKAIPASITLNEADRVSGKNGWYVPHLNGSLAWIDMQKTKDILEGLDLIEGTDSLLTPVSYYLYTNANPTDGQKITESAKSISASNFNPKNPTRILIHGWLESYTADHYKNISDAFLSVGNYNVIIVDWPRARGEYVTAVAAVSRVGKEIGNFIDNLVASHLLSLDELNVIGHSLGAQVAGYTGKNVKTGQIHTIVGLDPAMPLFNYNKPDERLNSEDALYVETIQTNGGKLGFLEPIGKAAFYVNGGESQLDCPNDLTGLCSHQRSTNYYAEAVRLNDFGSIQCSDYKDAVTKTCGSTFSSIRMGAAINANTASGYYYVPIKSTPPYGITN